MSIYTIFLMPLLGENIILTKYLGMNTFLNKEENEKNILSISISLIIVVLISTTLTYLINKYILLPTNALYLQTIVFVLLTVCVIELLDMIMKKYFTKYNTFTKNNLNLMILNTAIFGIVLNTLILDYDLIHSLIYSLGCSLGFIFIMYVITNLKNKLNNSEIPKSFKGLPISLIALGIIALIIGRLI